MAVFSSYTRKLEFYNTFKHCYEISSYLNLTRKTIDKKALVKLLVSNHKLMIETGRYNQLLKTKDYVPFVIPMKLRMKFTFSAIAQSI